MAGINIYRRTGNQTTSLEVSGRQSDTITYVVEGIDYSILKSQLLTGRGLDSSGDGTGHIPAYGERHTEIGGAGMYCQKYAIRETDIHNVCEVDAVFATNDITAYLHSDVDLSGDNYVYSANFGVRKTKIPIAVRSKKVVTTNGSSQVIGYWKVIEREVEENYMTIHITWQVDSSSVYALLDAIRSHNNEIHKINGILYHFTASSVIPIDNNTYEVKANWTTDGGTIAVASEDTTRYLTPADMHWVGTPPQAGYMRDPFRELGTLPADNPENGNNASDASGWPKMIQYQKYEEVNDGYDFLHLPSSVFGGG